MDGWRINGDFYVSGDNVNVHSPHDENIELKVRRACKSWTGDNFEAVCAVWIQKQELEVIEI